MIEKDEIVKKNAIYSSVHGYLREVSRQQLCLYLGKNHFLSRDFDKWSHAESEMKSASIALTGYSGTIIVEAHMWQNDIIRLVSERMGKPLAQMTNAAAVDFVAEYSNYMAGALRRVLEPNRIAFNRCIPTTQHTSRAECARIFRKKSHPCGIWVLTDGRLEVVCIAHLTITRVAPFKSAIPNLAMSLFDRPETGEIEYLV